MTVRRPKRARAKSVRADRWPRATKAGCRDDGRDLSEQAGSRR